MRVPYRTADLNMNPNLENYPRTNSNPNKDPKLLNPKPLNPKLLNP